MQNFCATFRLLINGIYVSELLFLTKIRSFNQSAFSRADVGKKETKVYRTGNKSNYAQIYNHPIPPTKIASREIQT